MLKLSDILGKVTTEDVIEIMKENGSDVYQVTTDGKSRQKCLWFKTICHNGNSHKLCYFTKTKDFYCYTSCGRMTFFNFIKVIRQADDKEFYSKVVLYVLKKINATYLLDKKRIGLSPKLSKQVIQDIREMEESFEIDEYEKKLEKVDEIKKIYSEQILEYFRDIYYEGWIKEGITINTMQKYKIKWYELKNSIIIPHYNIKNQLIGVRKRSLNEKDKNNKYMPLYIDGQSYEHPLGLNLYGLNFNIDAIKEQRKAIIVEGEKSVLLSDSYYGENSIAVATCGFNISEWQIKTICDLVDVVYLGFDKDFDGKLISEYKQNPSIYREYLRFENRIKSLALKFNGRCIVKRIKDTKGLLSIKDSPFDKGKKVLEELLKGAKNI